jgi:hypothetical protein
MGTETYELSNNTIHLETLRINMPTFVPIYLESVDTLVFRPEKPTAAISIDCEGELYLRVNPQTREIVGIEIEDFEQYFVIKHPEFAQIWKQTKGIIRRQRLQNESLTTFLTIVQELLSEIVIKQGCITLDDPLPASI